MVTSNMPTWKEEDLSRENLKKIAKELRILDPAIVERVLVLHDTLNLVAQVFQKRIIFTGGSMINPLYLQNAPRLSIDIDLIYKEPVEKKEDLLKFMVKKQEILNKERYTFLLDFEAFKEDVGYLELDTKRQHLYPGVLFLTRKCLTKYVGTPITKFLKNQGVHIKSKRDLKYFNDLKRDFEGEPRIYDIRVEILYSNVVKSIGFEQKEVPSYFSNVLHTKKNPILDVETPLDLCKGKLELILKLPKEQTQNILNAILDLRVLDLLKLKINVSSKVINKIEAVQQGLKKEYNKIFAYTYIRNIYSWDKIYNQIIESLKSRQFD
ncbi:MAG: nucleotidyl transferase AbiEii/AbiGii toxin family protein [Candidatus Helarchaeota archaeon]